jgi:hypothetical protein
MKIVKYQTENRYFFCSLSAVSDGGAIFLFSGAGEATARVGAGSERGRTVADPKGGGAKAKGCGVIAELLLTY